MCVCVCVCEDGDVAPWYEHSFMVLWIVGSILHGGQRLWYVLSCLWDGAYKGTLAAHVAAAGFLSRYLNDSLPSI